MQQRPDDPVTVEDLVYRAEGDWLACPNCLVVTPADMYFDEYLARNGNQLAREIRALCWECGYNRLAVYGYYPFNTEPPGY